MRGAARGLATWCLRHVVSISPGLRQRLLVSMFIDVHRGRKVTPLEIDTPFASVVLVTHLQSTWASLCSVKTYFCKVMTTMYWSPAAFVESTIHVDRGFSKPLTFIKYDGDRKALHRGPCSRCSSSYFATWLHCSRFCGPKTVPWQLYFHYFRVTYQIRPSCPGLNSCLEPTSSFTKPTAPRIEANVLYVTDFESLQLELLSSNLEYHKS